MNLMKIGLLIVISLSSASSFSQTKQLRLQPSSKFWSEFEPHPAIHTLHLPHQRRLASIGDSVYMVDRRGHIIWQWTSNGPPLTDLPIMDSSGTIYVLAQDLIWAAIDSRDGQEKWRGTANGRALYSQIRLYGPDMYLVVVNMAAYEDDLRQSHRSIEDNVRLCKGNAVLWDHNIPGGSKIQVEGKAVFVVYKQGKRRIRHRLQIPIRLRRQGRVSVLADYDGRKILDWKQ